MSSVNRFPDLLRFSGGGLRRRQRGQALTEVALSALLVLIPTFAIGWAMYAYGQARTSALNGARYAAWERTVWRGSAASGATTAVRSTSQIENLMVERFFARPDAAIKSSYASGEEATNAHLPSFYSVHNGDHVVDIENTDRTQDGKAARPTLKLEEDKKTTSSIASVYNGLADFTSLLGAQKMELEDKGLFVATVNVKLNAIRHLKVFDALNLDLTQRAAVVTDAWSAGGREHEEAIVKPLVPASMIGDVLAKFDVFLGLLPNNATPFSEFKPGCIKGDVVPSDTLIDPTQQLGYNPPPPWAPPWYVPSGPWETTKTDC